MPQKSRHNGQKQAKSLRNSKQEDSQVKKTFIVRIPRSLGWAAERYRCNLRFHAYSTLLHAGGFAFTNVRFTPTFAYDVDPTVGSTAMPGFTELSAMYRYYRVNAAKIKAKFSNLEAFPVEVYLCPVNVDPTANYTLAQAQVYLSQRLSKSTVLGPLTGNGIGTLTDSQTTAAFGGASNLEVTDNYSALTSGVSPLNNWFWTVGLVGHANAVSGCDFRVEIDIDLEFYEVTSPTN